MTIPDATAGVVLLGGAHGALSAARSFGRQKIPVVLVTDDHPLPTLSRYVRKSFDWPGPKSPQAIDWLIKFADTEKVHQWLILPCGDPEVRLIAEHVSQLGTAYRVLSPDWSVLRNVCDKQLLAQTAVACGVSIPEDYAITSPEDAAHVEVRFPLVLKPAMRLERNPFTAAKAWRANSRQELVDLFRKAASFVGSQNVVVQELVPGGGEAQFSYCALWLAGQPVAEMAGRRTRQYPVEFSFSSTFVEVVENDDVTLAGRKLLASIGFEGLVEVEFKFDARDRTYKVLDVNPRTWSWLELGAFCGVDFPLLLRDATLGNRISQPPSQSVGRAWVHLSRDLLVAIELIRRGEIGLGAYLDTLRQRLTFAAFAWDDPLPGLLELPLTAYRVLGRAVSRH